MSEEKVIMKVIKIPIEKIDLGEGNVRTRQLTKNLDELKKSVQLIGLQQPLVAFSKGDRYELIVGQRRLMALIDLGWKEVPVLVHPTMNVKDAKIISVTENLQRVDLSPKDKADVFKYLYDEFGSEKKVAEALGVSIQTVTKYLGYKILVPDSIKKIVEENRKYVTHEDALKIVQNVLPDVEKSKRLIEKFVKERLTRDERDRVIDASAEAPDETVEQISGRAESAKFQKEIYFVLPRKYGEAIEKASKDLGLGANDIAKRAVSEWLETGGYVL